MKKYGLFSLLLLLCLLFTSCSAHMASEEVKNYSHSADPANNVYYASVSDDGLSYVKSDVPSLADLYTSAAVISEEKLIYSANVTLETEDFDTASDTLHRTVTSLGGIIANEDAYNLNGINRHGTRTLSMTVRIPQVNYETFLAGLSDTYNVVSVNRSVQNLTTQYYDNETRLASLRVQETRLIEMLGETKTVAEMLEIESRLTEVQYQIESLTNTQRTIDNDVKYSTFYLSLTEVQKFTTPEPITFGERFSAAVKESAEEFGAFCQNVVISLVYLLPHLLVLAVVTVIVLIVVFSTRRKKAKAKAKPEEKE